MEHNKIVILSTGQPSTNPRMIKEVDALIAAGYNVKIFYSFWALWARFADEKLLKKYQGLFCEIGGNPVTGKQKYLFSKIIQRTAFYLSALFPFVTDYAIARTSFMLSNAAKKEKAALYIAHNLGALPAVVKAAKKYNTLCGFDAEDYHRGEYENTESKSYRLTKKIEDKYLPKCDYITAASPLIAKAYQFETSKTINVINNVFSKSFLQPLGNNNGKELSIFWFSQTVGTNRGLENIVTALNNLPQCEISLNLMGECSEQYKMHLKHISLKQGIINFLPPVPPDDIFKVAARFDVGLASEIPCNDNRNFCLTNKIFTYLLAGNCVLASDTLAQKQFMETYPGIGLLYSNDDSNTLSTQLELLYNNKEQLNKYKRASNNLAAEKFNWEIEQDKFLDIINGILN